MAGNSTHSAKIGKRSTSKLSPQDYLDIAQASISQLKESGSTMVQYFEKDGATVLILRGVSVCQQCHRWQFWENTTEHLCQKCASKADQVKAEPQLVPVPA